MIVVGLVVGLFVGVMVEACMVAASRDDDREGRR